jgi:hypothetical protein
MRNLSSMALAFTAAVCFAATTAPAQISIGVNVGPEPACHWGYYDYAPYNCAPYGYYGPEWFANGAFIGSGPWFHGHDDFRGHVNNHFDPQHGYHGHIPDRGEAPGKAKGHFKPNEVRDGRGNVANDKNDHHDNHDQH